MSSSSVYIDLPIDGVTTQIAVVPLIVDLPTNVVEGSIRYVDENKSIYSYDGNVWVLVVGSTGTGTVTSVAISTSAEFVVTGSPITTSGTIAISKATQLANKIFAGPTSGAAAQPTFRTLTSADIPGFSRSLTTTWIPANGTTKTVTHNWGTQKIRIEVLEIDTGYTTIIPDVASRPTINTVVLTISGAPTGSGFLIMLSEVLN